ncbi:MAG TPA: helix-turn-helix domain-containing protein [Micromonosporaceae bacterium]|nr:helix-turn-helix domain-containing protein [Micromonosporaceae bacterium]
MDKHERQTAAAPRGGPGVGAPEPAVGDGPDTRSRIQRVALALFIEHGYEKTSLREIAERLGVTKAALYYHFQTKDDIIQSLIEDRIARLDELLAWAQQQPRTPATRRELIQRYGEDLQSERHHEVMRFFERNQTAIKGMPAGVRMRDRMLALTDVLCDPGDPPARRLRSSLAIFAVHASAFLLRDPDLSDRQRHSAAMEVAFDLIDDGGTAGDGDPATRSPR